MAENSGQSSLLSEGSPPLQTTKTESVKNKDGNDASLKSSSTFRQQSPQRTDTKENLTSKSSEKRQSMFPVSSKIMFPLFLLALCDTITSPMNQNTRVTQLHFIKANV